MGNISTKSHLDRIKSTKEEDKESKKYLIYNAIAINRNSFNYISIIGRGGFGKVWKVFFEKYKCYYAMKEMSKTKIIDKKSEKSIKSERELLSKIHHKFIINMQFAFQDNENLYLVSDLLTGGDLRYHICKYRKFSEEQTRFFLACILLGLEYCHSNNVIHRDIKPENLVLDDKGYVHITDFGIAKIQQPNNYKETSGTPGYMSPEVICGKNHTIAVDYFALGVIGYEFMMGVRPYLGKSRKEIKEKIMAKQVQIKKSEIPEGWSLESADCINRLLQRKAEKRLGQRGAKEVKEHIWFKDFKWKDLYMEKMTSPFIPEKGENFDFKYCNAVEKQGLKTKERYAEIMLSDNYKNGFNDYYYFDRFEYDKQPNKDQFINIHEVMYENNNASDASTTVVHNRYRSVDEQQKYINYKRIIPSSIVHNRNLSAMNGNQAFFEANMFVNQRIQKKNYESNISRNVKNNVHHSKYSSYNGEMLNNNANSNYTKGGSVISNTNDIYNKSTGFNSNVNK